MEAILPNNINDINVGFSVFDDISYSNSELPLGNILSGNYFRDMFADSESLFGGDEDDTWDTGLTLWAFLGQVLQDGKLSSCTAAVTNAARLMIDNGLQPPSPDTGAYCKARPKLDLNIIKKLVGSIADKMSDINSKNWLWCDREVKLVDGFTCTMPDTPDNQKAFPQSKSQAIGVGFPIARCCAVISLANATIHDVAIGPYKGKETGESALLRQVLEAFKPGDVMLADRYFCSYWILAIMKSRGVDCCMRLHQLRKIDKSKVKWLGDNDCIDIWHKPQRAKWMSEALYDSLPQQIEIRIVTLDQKTKSGDEAMDVVTTLLDHEQYTSKDIGQLYNYRWCVELDISSIKTALRLDHLKCKTPKMIHLEFWVTLLAYNMIRLVCAQAAYAYNKFPRQMSFTTASNTLALQWAVPPKKESRQLLGEYNLKQIARNIVGNRPGRTEPRVLKRRPKPYSLMMKPRSAYK